ncbi:hypothetical protein JTB14_025754 [Gonioctena quinquepunctata]|nr:hypothetical protein JTB14_025754 [Gonioctena quinquepunctata]
MFPPYSKKKNNNESSTIIHKDQSTCKGHKPNHFGKIQGFFVMERRGINSRRWDFNELVGCDISEEMLESARKNFQHPRVSFILMDISTKNLPSELENRFDHIFSFFCFHWVQNPKQALTNLYKMLKPGGEIFLLFIERHSFDVPYENLSKYEKWSKYGHENFISPFHHSLNAHEEWKMAMDEAGFHNGVCKLEETFFEYEDEKAFEDLWLSVNPIFTKVPKKDREEYRRDHMKEMIKPKENFIHQNIEGRPFRSDFNIIIMLAKKNVLAVNGQNGYNHS